MIALASAGCANPSGFHATFTANSFNMADAGSSYETGQVNIDFVGQRASSVFEFYAQDGKIYSGLTWAFGTNQTAYFMDTNGNCQESPSNVAFPTGWPAVIKDDGSYTIGVYPVEMLEVESEVTSVNQTVFFDTDNCALVSSYLTNADQSNPGFSTINYFNVGLPSEAAFQLPQACINAVGSSKSIFKFNHRRENVHSPVSKALKYTLNALSN
ncbi:hypothetical protein CYY_008034 [Polysphondylium violaceum]|uniref:Uncharacterized protein n=1 Tax=Polysphondylium violaceum TaxID=133409 RepID=A0A8J4PPH1_9MYCE|nr:hypothetical protein CYY_008034 [Polysphondylium violaceum]